MSYFRFASSSEVQMSVLSKESDRRKGAIRGRESRNRTLTTKLSATESVEVQTASQQTGKSLGEWLRDVALSAARRSAEDELLLLTEIMGLRLMLTNLFKPLATGQKLTSEAFDNMLSEVKKRKRSVAEDALQDLERA